MEAQRDSLRRVRAIANYQFGADVGANLFPENAKMTYSKKTGRIRYIYLGETLLATLRPKDGLFSLAPAGALRLLMTLPPMRLQVTVREDVANFVAQGSDVFARHVKQADPMLRPGEEVLVVDPKGDLLAVGKALLSGNEMLSFKRGVAVKVRRGVEVQ